MIFEQLAAKGIWELIKEAAKALWKGVKKVPPSSNSNPTTTPPGKKRRKRSKNGGTKSWIFKIILEKR